MLLGLCSGCALQPGCHSCFYVQLLSCCPLSPGRLVQEAFRASFWPPPCSTHTQLPTVPCRPSRALRESPQEIIEPGVPLVKGCTPQELRWVCMQGLGLKQTQGVVPVKGHTPARVSLARGCGQREAGHRDWAGAPGAPRPAVPAGFSEPTARVRSLWCSRARATRPGAEQAFLLSSGALSPGHLLLRAERLLPPRPTSALPSSFQVAGAAARK